MYRCVNPIGAKLTPDINAPNVSLFNVGDHIISKGKYVLPHMTWIQMETPTGIMWTCQSDNIQKIVYWEPENIKESIRTSRDVNRSSNKFRKISIALLIIGCICLIGGAMLPLVTENSLISNKSYTLMDFSSIDYRLFLLLLGIYNAPLVFTFIQIIFILIFNYKTCNGCFSCLVITTSCISAILFTFMFIGLSKLSNSLDTVTIDIGVYIYYIAIVCVLIGNVLSFFIEYDEQYKQYTVIPMSEIQSV